MSYPKATRIRLVMDNLNIHCEKSLTATFGLQIGSQIWRRFAVHLTPKHGSWRNQAEIEIGIFAKQCLGNRRINKAATKINWQLDRKAARKTFGYDQNCFKRSWH